MDGNHIAQEHSVLPVRGTPALIKQRRPGCLDLPQARVLFPVPISIVCNNTTPLTGVKRKRNQHSHLVKHNDNVNDTAFGLVTYVFCTLHAPQLVLYHRTGPFHLL